CQQLHKLPEQQSKSTDQSLAQNSQKRCSFNALTSKRSHMYAKYDYVAGATLANIMNDINLIITGETNINNLSASCAKSTTEIVAAVAAGWVLHDALAGTNKKCYKAPLADDATKFKYMVLDFNSSGYLKTTIYETWDATAHTGTNLCYYSDQSSYGQKIDTTAGGTMYVFASVRFAVFASNTNQWSSGSGPTGVVERTRDLPFDTVAAGYPPFGFIHFYSSSYVYPLFFPPRVLTMDGSVVVSPQTGFGVNLMFSGAPSGIAMKIPSGTGTFLVPFYPGYVTNYSTYMPAPYGEFSSLCDIWKIPSNVANHLSTITKAGVDYLAMKTYTSSTEMFVIRKS
ncbi:hypothetical protein, partial [Candidatus Magnetaquicoccus inordinatus]|uniref:hypothetical protein n=1 Tax=Candidatus Magnetaquicoccus inordinatus TaxID=2496818 RepID=UPI001D0F04C5